VQGVDNNKIIFASSPVGGSVRKSIRNETQDALKQQLHNDVLKRDPSKKVDETKRSSAKAPYSPPENMDQLSAAVHHILMDKHLEVSKVRPFFWSMVEAYVDRFQIYPFDIVKALFSYLESSDYPPDLMRDLVTKLEECYDRQYGEPMHKSTKLVCEGDCLDHEVKELRESLKYAALVDELEEA
jgi:hypothetical protein